MINGVTRSGNTTGAGNGPQSVDYIMKCGYPIKKGENIFPCGRCMPCRINTKRMWTGRILLETNSYKNSSTFLTLTYNDENKPEDNSLSFRDLKVFIDNLRHTSLGQFRYFAVGEYGDKTARPHYHMAIFNCPPEKWESKFVQSWKQGFIKAGDITPQSAAYVAGYCTKKMTSKEDERLQGRIPEFSRMSKKPPLGAAGVARIEQMLYSKHGAQLLESYGDVPGGYRIQGKIYPLGRYWKTYLRKRLGIEAPTDNPWEVDPYEQTKQEQEQARKQAAKLWRQRNRTRRAI